MDRGLLLELFCSEFVKLVNDGYETRFFFLCDQAKSNLRKRGQKLSKPFKDETIILQLRHRRVRVVGKNGIIHCDGISEGTRPRTGVGTKVYPCT
jgi:hypothetical protein